MNARHSKSCFRSQSSRSSAARSYGPSRLQSTRYCGGATVEIGSIWSQPRCRTVSSTLFADPSSSCARTAMRRASARLTSMDFTEFVLSHLPSPQCRVLEVGCGTGELARALAARGHDVLAIDPEAPQGPIFRRTTIEELDDPGTFDAALASFSLHHVTALEPVLDKLAVLLATHELLIVDEFGWDLLDDDRVLAPTECREDLVELLVRVDRGQRRLHRGGDVLV